MSAQAGAEGALEETLVENNEREEQFGSHDEDVDHTADVESQLQKLVEKHVNAGNAHLAQQEWEQASQQFTLALKFARGDKGTAAAVLSNRSAALCSWCTQLRSRPAALSESRAIFAPDPMHLAQLALKDAERATQLKPIWHKGYSRQGAALFLLERYSEAEAAYLEGLVLAPGDGALTEGLKLVQAVLAEQQRAGAPAGDGAGAGDVEGEGGGDDQGEGAGGEGRAWPKRQRRLTKDTQDDLECILCLKLLCEPVTTPCGHTFCKSCFSRVLDHSSKCPCCRTVLHVARELPVSITLKNILAKSFPDEYGARLAEEAAAAAAAAEAGGGGGGGGGGAATLPLFVMSTILPGEKMALNIFEPRYRLMVRRCMEGSHLMGMAQVGSDRNLDPVACEAAITECQQLPDGRYYLELTGRRRVRLRRCWEQDGYRMADVEALRDSPPDAGSQESADLARVASEVESLSDTFMGRLRSFYSGRRLAQLLSMMERVGDKPSNDPEALSWYIGRILLLFAPDDEGALRDRLLASTSTLTRLREEQRILQGRLDGTGACAVM